MALPHKTHRDRAAPALRASTVGGDAPASRRYPAGRVCREPGCDTVLSVYNPRELCGQHERPSPFTHRVARKTKLGFRRS